MEDGEDICDFSRPSIFMLGRGEELESAAMFALWSVICTWPFANIALRPDGLWMLPPMRH